MRIAMIGPMLGPVNLALYVYNGDWVVVGSGTGGEDAILGLLECPLPTAFARETIRSQDLERMRARRNRSPSSSMYEYRHYIVGIKGMPCYLDPRAEEIASSWARKIGARSVKEPDTIRDYWKKFSRALEPNFGAAVRHFRFPQDFDFSEIRGDLENRRKSRGMK